MLKLGLQRVTRILVDCEIHYSLALLAVLCATLLLKHYFKNKHFYDLAAKIPGPSGCLPLIGHGHRFLGLNMAEVIEEMIRLQKSYKTPLKYWLGSQLMVALADPKDVQVVLTSEDSVNKPYVYGFFNVQTNGLFLASGDTWRKLRKITNSTFNTKLLEQFVTIFNEESKTLCHVLSDEANGKVIINIHDFVVRCTLDMVCGAQMGVRTKEQTENTSNFDHYVARSTEIIVERIHKAYLHPDFMFNLTTCSKEHKEIIVPVHSFVNKVVKQRQLIRQQCDNLEECQSKVKQKTIFLDAILDNYPEKTEKELVYLVSDMIIGGSDLTSVTASYALLMLAMHPQVQEKVYQEQYDLLKTSLAPLTITDLNDMKYLDMVIKESLRLFSTPANARLLTRDIDIEHYTLPAGAIAYISIYSLHKDPKYWQHPNIFYPEHFLPENVAKRPKFSFIPFSMGPRNCPGHKYGMLAVKIMLSYVVRHYIMTSHTKLEEMRYKMAFMLVPTNGYPVSLQKRNEIKLLM